jgi:hypothetical protein
MSDSDSLDTIDINGMGELPSPQACQENKDQRKVTHTIHSDCPVCGAGPYSTWSKLQGHFGNVNDAAHQNYDLTLEEFK